MKKILIYFAVIPFYIQAQNVGINTDNSTPDPSAIVDIKSSVKGLLLPRLTATERDAISSPATGLMIFQKDALSGLYVNSGTPAVPVWTIVGPAISGTPNYLIKFSTANSGGNSLIYDNGTNIGIGTTIPGYPLQVVAANTTYSSYFVNTNAAGTALFAQNTAASGSSTGTGIIGTSSQSGGAGLKGLNSNGTGTGIMGAGNNTSPVTLVTGSGGSFIGSATGIFAESTTTTGVAQALYTDNAGAVVRVNYWNGVTQYKINGSGSVSTVVKDQKGGLITLHATETPEIYFQDYGAGKLINGRVHIDIDPLFEKNIVVNESHPLRVFIQPEGDCKGVYITNKTAKGFDVVELNNGTSNINFQWTIICNRADEDFGNGRISRNADTRFEPAARPEQTVLQQ
ncbi:MAG: hypothetical protein ABJA78_15650 [Ferruginibacter sp.]